MHCPNTKFIAGAIALSLLSPLLTPSLELQAIAQTRTEQKIKNNPAISSQSSHSLQQGIQLSQNVEPLLSVQGRLEAGDPDLDDGSLYDDHTFPGEAGEWVTITLESIDFDSYLLVYTPAMLHHPFGRRIGENDDIAVDNFNSSITLRLPISGDYRVRATAYDAQDRGQYTLTVLPGQRVPSLSGAALRQIEANHLVEQGIRQFNTSQFYEAERSVSRALEIYRQISDRRGEGIALSHLGNAHSALGNYQQAADYYENYLTIAKEMDDRQGEAHALGNLGIVYAALGQYLRAVDHYRKHLEIARDIRDRDGESNALGNLGEAYAALGDYRQALEFHQQSLSLEREIGDRQGEAYSLISLGDVYVALKQYQQAIEEYQQALPILDKINDRYGEAYALGGLGVASNALGESSQAVERYKQALLIATEVGDRENQGALLSHIAEWFTEQDQPELAIVYYKQSVNLREEIRRGIRSLPIDLQHSYRETIADSYRALADLLLKQGRILEAQEVLDLLKLQEVDDYLRENQSSDQTPPGLDLWEQEQQILELYDQTIRQNPSANFEMFSENSEVMALVEELHRTAREQSLNSQQLYNLQDNLQQLEEPAALLYHLILPDRLEILLIPPNSPPISRSVSVSQKDLEQAIAEFRSQLQIQNRTSDIIPQAQQLYRWLIQPIAADLEQTGAETIIYAADGRLRYIPLAALHDGNRWLIQDFTINYITAASLTDFNQEHENELQVLAAAFSDTNETYTFDIDKIPYSFTGLKYAGIEVETIADEIPTTTTLFNQQFSRVAVEQRMNDYTIVHFATHAAFGSGPDNSFIVFGNREHVTLRDIDDWLLPNVDLVVLSACETAVGGELRDGAEILGFGYQIQQAQARAAIASLWRVNDGGTQVLMNAFYAALEQDGLTKAEALQQSQVALITGNYADLGVEASPELTPTLDHPYYWAPFILIGNGL
jgi:CHAT domain-containing protein/Flp pilus assembly protein TadD